MTDRPGLTRSSATVAAFDDEGLSRLLRGCASGQRTDLERLYRLCAPRVLGQLVLMLRDRGLAEDALQEVFLKVWDRASQFDPARGRPLTWLLAIARNHALDQLRAQRAQPLSAGELPDLPGEDADWTQLESRASGVALQRCLQGLTDVQRRCLRLAYVAGLSQEQIAGALQSPVGSVKSWIRRSLLSLRECLGP